MIKQLCMNMTCGAATRYSNQLFHNTKELIGKSILERKKEKILTSSIHFSCPRHKNTKSASSTALWQTQKQRKAVRDESYAVTMTKLAVNIKKTLYKDKKLNADPKSNPDLAKVIKQAQGMKIPGDVIKKEIEKQIQKKEQVQDLLALSAKGLENTGMIVEVYTNKLNRSKAELQPMIKKAGFSAMKPADDLFEYKGVIDVALPEEERSVIKSEPGKFDLDRYVDLAIESGADIEDVKLVSGIDLPFLQFECDASVLDTVHEILEDAGLVVLSSQAVYLPTSTVPVSSEFLELLEKCEQRMITELPGFQAMYCNVEPKES